MDGVLDGVKTWADLEQFGHLQQKHRQGNESKSPMAWTRFQSHEGPTKYPASSWMTLHHEWYVTGTQTVWKVRRP